MTFYMENPWSKAEEARLREMNAAGEGDPAIAKALGRSKACVGHKRRRMGIPANDYRATWTPKRDALLVSLWPKTSLTAAAVAEQLGFSVSAVRDRARGLGLPNRATSAARPPVTAPGRDEVTIEERRDRQHVANCLRLGGFPALSEQLIGEARGARKFKCVMPLVWPEQRAA